ncbi:esterase FrsA [Vibrio sp. CAIM 722]|uniref:Esterase FrsA n=1 Tax=Vibrio eleionomae TaxID=2653505 RepID=A0A7X4LH85_9VIBR|nr:esterase FrsA [Vibrio eleionomae]MZI91685.1 esterase FrsA [Vibrio eleionomae]
MPEEQSKNLSETLFRKHKQAKETSALASYLPSSVELLRKKREEEGFAWYRNLRRLQWIWQGIDPVEQEEVLARIAASKHSRTVDTWLDTVMGYHSGNWTFEWNRLGMRHQQRAKNNEGEVAADEWFNAALCYSIAGYPHLKNDSLALQAQNLANTAYQEGAKQTQYVVKRLEFPFQGKKIIGHLHLAKTDTPKPVVIVSGGLDSLQTDMWRLFRDYFAQRDIAMLTIDMPSIGQSSHWSISENTSILHQEVLHQLYDLPWVDHRRVGLVGFRFGGNAMARLSFLEPERVKACVTLGAPIHDVFVAPDKLKKMSKMYLDVLASRLGKNAVDISSMAGQIMAWSLKVQGFLSSRRTKVPILALGMEGDPVCPHSDNQLLALFSQYGKATQIKSKTISQGYEQALDLAIKWLEDELSR